LHIKTLLTNRFGKMALQQLPMVHVGILYEIYKSGYKLSQSKFADDLKPIVIDKMKLHKLELDCLPAETTSLRAALGALLFLCITRLDLIADVVVLQTTVCAAKIKDLKQANALINRAKAFRTRGLIYLPIKLPLRVVSISDASHATSKTSYAIEGQISLIMHDTMAKVTKSKELDLGETKAYLDGNAHILCVSSKKAKRISHSTSHAESLAMHGTLTTSEMLCMRFTEIFAPRTLKLADLIAFDDDAMFDLPLDHLTDCMDLVHLCVGQRGIPQDRSQRLIVLSLREKRMIGKIRCLLHVDTHDMAANRLTKYDPSDYSFMTILDHGFCVYKHPAKCFAPVPDRWKVYDETDLLTMKDMS
jgi:hypothetical protein